MSEKTVDTSGEALESIISVGYAVCIIVVALIVIFGFFIAPVPFFLKVYLFMFICILSAFLLTRFKSYRYNRLSDDSPYSLNEKLTLAITGAAVLWCGGVKFIQYWTPGGADPYFHDLTSIYIVSLLPLLVSWGVALIYSPGKNTIRSVLWCFQAWAFGYLVMFGLIFFILVVVDS